MTRSLHTSDGYMPLKEGIKMGMKDIGSVAGAIGKMGAKGLNYVIGSRTKDVKGVLAGDIRSMTKVAGMTGSMVDMSKLADRVVKDLGSEWVGGQMREWMKSGKTAAALGKETGVGSSKDFYELFVQLTKRVNPWK